MNLDFLNFKTPHEVAMELAEKEKAKRKYKKLTQQQLADRSGVSLGSLKRFEQTGEISLTSLLKLAFVLDSLKDFEGLFPKTEYKSIQEIIDANNK